MYVHWLKVEFIVSMFMHSWSFWNHADHLYSFLNEAFLFSVDIFLDSES